MWRKRPIPCRRWHISLVSAHGVHITCAAIPAIFVCCASVEQSGYIKNPLINGFRLAPDLPVLWRQSWQLSKKEETNMLSFMTIEMQRANAIRNGRPLPARRRLRSFRKNRVQKIVQYLSDPFGSDGCRFPAVLGEHLWEVQVVIQHVHIFACTDP